MSLVIVIIILHSLEICLINNGVVTNFRVDICSSTLSVLTGSFQPVFDNTVRNVT